MADRINAVLENEIFKREYEKITENEKTRKFCRHGIDHLIDVARIMYIKSLEEGLDIPKDIIYTAALLHDIGRGMQYTERIPHDVAGVSLAKEILPECGFSQDEIKTVTDAISEHRDGGASPLSKLLYSADKESRMCFACEMRDECYWDDDKKNGGITV